MAHFDSLNDDCDPDAGLATTPLITKARSYVESNNAGIRLLLSYAIKAGKNEITRETRTCIEMEYC